MIPAEQAARDVVIVWAAQAKQGWVATHACQHGTTCCSEDEMGPDDVDLDALIGDVAAAIEQARREEREACAVLVEQCEPETGPEVAMLRSIAAAIRARAQEQP